MTNALLIFEALVVIVAVGAVLLGDWKAPQPATTPVKTRHGYRRRF